MKNAATTGHGNRRLSRRAAADRSGRLAAHEIAGFSICAFELRPEYRMGTHAHARSGLVLPLAGHFRAMIGSRTLDVLDDMVAVLPGDLLHHESVGPRGSSCLLVIPHALGPRDENGLDLESAASARRPDLARLGRHLWCELGTEDSPTSLVAESLLLDLFAASPSAPAEEWDAAPAWIRRVEELVQDRFADPLTHEEIAREIGVSREHLARTFRRFAGIPLGVFVRRIRVLRAARGLRESQRSIAQIAVQCGFADHSHLARTFRRHFQLSPLEYRARLVRGGGRGS